VHPGAGLDQGAEEASGQIEPVFFSGVEVGGSQGSPRRGRAGRHAVRDAHALHTPSLHGALRPALARPLAPGAGRHRQGRGRCGAEPAAGWLGPEGEAGVGRRAGCLGGRGLPEGGLLSPPSLVFLLFEQQGYALALTGRQRDLVDDWEGHPKYYAYTDLKGGLSLEDGTQAASHVYIGTDARRPPLRHANKQWPIDEHSYAEIDGFVAR
jgi:hypothetical protein